ncbi:transcriptional repressor LexA [Tessaracoccus sp. OS52]|uniref:transcriptional repressor LexA n=1 Tax=Tessaracoccus sp. OS52 TaxID=2886691 RepID=UPI001D103B02|nr:transcriptional repressor LexA [Tessaracoccus sp. OS52]MCC2593123.1 transcriptional repressor LexA [Tessaracoccus sp. OS52]
MADERKNPPKRASRAGRPTTAQVEADLDGIAILPDGPEDAYGLTHRQRRILQVIKEAVETVGYPPSIRELARQAGLASTSSVSYQLKVLEEKGFLRRDPNRPRALVVTIPDGAAPRQAASAELSSEQSYNNAPNSVNAPLVGRIAAGGPILAEERVEDVFSLPKQLVGDGNLFLLEVSGDSMIDAAICDGDFVVVRQQNDAINGDIVAALIEDEATVKTLKRKDGKVWLMPHNENYEPIDGTNAHIMGKVVAILRRV